MSNLNERLDPYFLSIGIEPQSMAATGRKYEGDYQGRLLKADCSRRSRTRYYGEVRTRRYHGHRLNFTLSTPLRTRLILSPAGTLSTIVGFFNRRAGLVELADLDPHYDYLTIWAFEPAWAYQLLARPEAQQLIHYLLPPDNLPDSIALNLQPEQLLFSQRIGLDQITPEQVDHWVTSLNNLLQWAEYLPAPTRVAELTWFEKKSKENPILVGLALFGGLIALFMLLGLCMAGCLIAFSLIAG